jgi:glycosyl transferase family 2
LEALRNRGEKCEGNEQATLQNRTRNGGLVKLFMTLLVRDEEDIIAANIAYHLSRGVDHIIVTDNRSVDGTHAILEEFVRTGRVTLLDERGDNFSQFLWVTRMARAAAEMGADWVINSDADEMWWALQGDLKTELETIPPECGSLIVPRSNVLPLRVLSGHAFERMVFREVESTNTRGQPQPGKAIHRATRDIEVQNGNHTVLSPSLGPSANALGMMIWHFPYRSYAQYEHKIANGGAAMARNMTLPKGIGIHWRDRYERLQAGTLRAWYDALPHADDSGLGEWVARGKVIEDRRLADYLRTALAGSFKYARANQTQSVRSKVRY